MQQKIVFIINSVLLCCMSEQKRAEGKQIFSKGGQAGSKGGCLKKGGGAGTPLRTMEFAYSYNGILWSWVIFINRSWNEDDLGEGNLIFWCTGPTDSKFWQIKIIILISQKIFSFFFTVYISFDIIFFY